MEDDQYIPEPFDVISDAEALRVFSIVSGYSITDNFEVVRVCDRRIVWRKNGYGGRMYADEMEILDDGRVFIWHDLKPVQVILSELTPTTTKTK